MLIRWLTVSKQIQRLGSEHDQLTGELRHVDARGRWIRMVPVPRHPYRLEQRVAGQLCLGFDVETRPGILVRLWWGLRGWRWRRLTTEERRPGPNGPFRWEVDD